MEIGRGGVDLSSRPQLFERAASWERSELCDGSATIGYLNHRASFDQPEQLAGTLSELSHTHRCHVQQIAHSAHLGKALSKLSALRSGELPGTQDDSERSGGKG